MFTFKSKCGNYAKHSAYRYLKNDKKPDRAWTT